MLEITGLSTRYADSDFGIQNIHLRAEKGESIALVGANGAGKTTFLLAVVGILEKTAGSITVDGVALDKKNLSLVRKKIGLVFQNPDDQLFMPDIYNDVAFGPRNAGLSPEAVEARVDEVLRELGISRLRNRSSLRLSGGEKRMAAIAGVLAMEPTVMLFDEPTAFLDPRARRALVNTLNRLPQTRIIATHDMDFALETCKRTVLIKEGEIYADGLSSEILYNRELMEHCYVEALPADRKKG